MNDLIHKFSNRNFYFKWNDDGQEVGAEIMFPDLSKAHVSTWGDWGPMHSFELSAGTEITISHEGSVYALDQDKIDFLSPISVQERKENPYYTLIKDEQRQKTFYLYFDESCDLVRVESWCHKDKKRSHKVQAKKAVVLEAAV